MRITEYLLQYYKGFNHEDAKGANKKKLIAKKRQGQKRRFAPANPHIYQAPKTATEMGIVCVEGNTGQPYGLPVVWFDYELGEKNHRSGFVCDDHKVSDRVEKLAQPQIITVTI